MKKVAVILICVLTIAALTACFAACADNSADENFTPGDGDVLVVYFSGTGNTERVAEYIADYTGASVLELQPADPYTGADLNWTDENSRVVREHENEQLQNSVELEVVTPENWDGYETVFIGYPIWWGIAAWPVNGFVTGNDFTGKTVIPFCTSSSSGMGQSGERLEEMAGSGTWLSGQRFSSGARQSTVGDWLSGLGF